MTVLTEYQRVLNELRYSTDNGGLNKPDHSFPFNSLLAIPLLNFIYMKLRKVKRGFDFHSSYNSKLKKGKLH